MKKRNEAFEAMHKIAYLDIESYEANIDDLKKLKKMVTAFLDPK